MNITAIKNDLRQMINDMDDEELEYPINVIDNYLEDNVIQMDVDTYQELEKWFLQEAANALSDLR